MQPKTQAGQAGEPIPIRPMARTTPRNGDDREVSASDHEFGSPATVHLALEPEICRKDLREPDVVR